MSRSSKEHDQGAAENARCHLHYEHIDRKAPSSEIVALMRSELHIATEGHFVLRPSQANSAHRRMHCDMRDHDFSEKRPTAFSVVGRR